MSVNAAIAEWQTLLGSAQVVQGDAAQAAYGADTTGQQRDLPAALRVTDSAQLPALMRIAQRHQVPVYPISTGHNWGYGSALPASHGSVIVDLSALRQILHFDAEMGVVTVQPGVTLGMLSAFLDQGKHPFMTPVTGAGASCSLLGNALERGYGITPHTDHFAAVTDIEAVLADGSIYRTALAEAGGEDLARLFKWGVGPYSAGLFSQSGFGIVTRMSIVLAPRPACVKICLFNLKDDALLEQAVARIRLILSRLPGTVGGINLMNRHRVLAMTAPYPRDQLEDGLIPPALVQQLGRQYGIAPWTGFGTLYGTDRMVAAAQKEIRAALEGVGSRILFLNARHASGLLAAARVIPGAGGRRLASTAATLAGSLELVAGRPNETALPLAYWRHPTFVPASPALARHPARDGCGLIWYAPLVPMRPQGARAYLQMVTEVTRKHGMEPLLTFTSLSDKLFDSTVPLLFDRNDPAAVAAAEACYLELTVRGKENGWFPYRVSVGAMPALAQRMDASAAFHARLREGIDPDNLMAPGRYR